MKTPFFLFTSTHRRRDKSGAASLTTPGWTISRGWSCPVQPVGGAQEKRAKTRPTKIRVGQNRGTREKNLIRVGRDLNARGRNQLLTYPGFHRVHIAGNPLNHSGTDATCQCWSTSIYIHCKALVMALLEKRMPTMTHRLEIKLRDIEGRSV